MENDAAFYALPSQKQAQLWAERTPADFVMNFKAFATLTTHHTDPKRLPKDIREALPKETAAKRRVYPKDFPKDARELLPDDRLAVEFRNATWMSERNRAETLSFLEEHGLTYVAVDEPQGFPSSMPPVAAVTNDALAIVRFHGRNAENWKKPGLTAAERFDYSYKKKELEEWIPKIREIAERTKEVHLLMNNCYGDKAVNNAAELAKLLD